MASQVDLQSLMEAAVAERVGRQSDTNTNFLAMLDRVFGKVYAEVDPVEAAAARQVMYREAPIERSKTS